MKTKLTQERVIESYQQGMSLKEIIKTFRVSETNIYAILDRYNIPRRRFLNKEKEKYE